MTTDDTSPVCQFCHRSDDARPFAVVRRPDGRRYAWHAECWDRADLLVTLDAERARHAALVAAAEHMLAHHDDIVADMGKDPAACWEREALRAALGDER